MKKISHHSKLQHRFTITTAIVLAVASFLTAFTRQAFAAPEAKTGEHFITIHDRGEEIGILTKQATLREAFKEAGVVVDENDLVEPGIDETLVASSYQVNIYRARPVIIIDGISTQKVLTPYQTSKQIVEDAGLKLRDEDKTTVEPIADIVTHGAGLQVVIDRATPVKLVLYGADTVVYTQAKSVEEFLREKSIELAASDTLSVKKTDAIEPHMKIEIWRNGKQTVTKNVAIDFPVVYIQDADREVGYRKIKTAGQKGVKKVTYEYTMQDGKVKKRKVIQSITVKKPVKQVEIVGAKQRNFGGDCSSWMAAAGIRDTANASYLIGRESGCNPYAVNAGSGACGVAQELPCGKSGCQLGDGACQTAWMNSYVIGRYGSWANAVAHHHAMGWY